MAEATPILVDRGFSIMFCGVARNNVTTSTRTVAVAAILTLSSLIGIM